MGGGGKTVGRPQSRSPGSSANPPHNSRHTRPPGAMLLPCWAPRRTTSCPRESSLSPGANSDPRARGWGGAVRIFPHSPTKDFPKCISKQWQTCFLFRKKFSISSCKPWVSQLATFEQRVLLQKQNEHFFSVHPSPLQ